MTDHQSTKNYTQTHPVPASDTLVLGSATATSYGPRVDPYNDGNIEPAKRAEDAEFWSVYEWWPSRHAPKGGWWEWRADCDTEDSARSLAEAIAGVAQQPAAVNDAMVDHAEENLAALNAENERLRDEALLQQALDALEYASDLTKLDGLQGCDCTICTNITAIRERLGIKEQT